MGVVGREQGPLQTQHPDKAVTGRCLFHPLGFQHGVGDAGELHDFGRDAAAWAQADEAVVFLRFTGAGDAEHGKLNNLLLPGAEAGGLRIQHDDVVKAFKKRIEHNMFSFICLLIIL